VGDVRLLFTRAEEVGFLGAIAAVKHGTMPRASRVLALENSRSFADSPIHGGPIVRVGDRLSVFSPALTAAVAARAAEIAGASASSSGPPRIEPASPWRWQRKLMAGGACEATVFCQGGYEATCLCLPLGNYHNMADLDAVQAGMHSGPPAIEREFIGLDDFEGLVDLLVACGLRLPDTPTAPVRVEKIWADLAFVLEPRRDGDSR
jgi:endoglucanase